MTSSTVNRGHFNENQIVTTDYLILLTNGCEIRLPVIPSSEN